MTQSTQIEIVKLSAGTLYGTSDQAQRLVVRVNGAQCADVQTQAKGAGHIWNADLPVTALSDGATMVTVEIAGDPAVHARLSILAGDILREDALSEIAQLRVEVDQLKAVVRRMGRSGSGT